MSTHAAKSYAQALGAAALFCFTSALAPNALAQRGSDAGPFTGLAGTWSGTGTITLSSGATERIRCRATYALGESGRLLQQNLRCASDSFNFDLRSNVQHDAGAITGTWTETTRQAQGTVNGRASPGQIQASIQGPTFSANLALGTRGDQQSISIRSQGTELTAVAITLNRS